MSYWFPILLEKQLNQANAETDRTFCHVREICR